MVSGSQTPGKLVADLPYQEDIDDATISVRFKHGIHTIYLFIDALGTMSAVTDELLKLLRERYPSGLTTSIAPPKKTTVPENTRLAYGVLSIPNDPTRGWKKIKIGSDGVFTPTKAGIKNNSIVAFAFVDEDEDEDAEVEFEVEWPREEDMYEQPS